MKKEPFQNYLEKLNLHIHAFVSIVLIKLPTNNN